MRAALVSPKDHRAFAEQCLRTDAQPAVRQGADDPWRGRDTQADTRRTVGEVGGPGGLGSDQRCQAGFPWNYDRDEIIADGVIHAIGICFGLIGAVIIIIIIASHSTKTVAIASVLTYAVALVAMLGFSAAYNMWPVSRTKWVLRRFDHSAIYLLIAGTYTPFIAQLKNSFASGGLLTGIWITAGVGVVLKLVLPGRFDRVAVVAYLLLGWSGVMAYDVIGSLPSLTLWLLAAGGLLYSIGVVFHLWASLHFQNAIWHTFVLVAAICHYTAVLEYAALARAGPEDTFSHSPTRASNRPQVCQPQSLNAAIKETCHLTQSGPADMRQVIPLGYGIQPANASYPLALLRACR